MNLPAGPMSLAVGFQYQEQKYNDKPSPILSSADIIGGGGEQPPVAGDRDVFSLFGELSIPIIKNLDAQVAVRWDDYSDFGSNVSPKVGIRWQPSSALLVRASYGQGFRAPTIPDLVSPPARTNSGGHYNDPWYDDQVGCGVTGRRRHLQPAVLRRAAAGHELRQQEPAARDIGTLVGRIRARADA